MNRRSTPLVLVVGVVLAMFVFPLLIIRAQPPPDVDTKIAEAFAAVREAERSGGDVGSLVDRLNEALALVAEGESLERSNPSEALELFQRAGDLASEVRLQAPSVRDAGVRVRQGQLWVLAGQLGALGVLGVAVYGVGPRLFWRVWLRAHREWRVRRI